MIAGGGSRPMRCSAASTSAMAARRPASDWRIARSLSSSGLSLASVSAIRAFGRAQAAGGVDQRLVELAAVLADGVDFELEPGLGLRGLLLLGADVFEFLVALAQRVERRLGGCAGQERGA